MMDQLGEVGRFLREDPLSLNAVNQTQEMIAIAKAIRQRKREWP